MGFLDDMLDKTVDAFDQGVSVAKGAVSGVAVENQPFMRGFARLCQDGWNQDWHDANGGNLSYRLKEQEVAAVRDYFYTDERVWETLPVTVPELAGEFFAITAAGKSMRSVAFDLDAGMGIIELNENGDAYRAVWGFKEGAKPTSELAGHLMNFQARMAAGDTDCRVMYHSHPLYLIAMTKLIQADDKTITRKLWQSMTESLIVFPDGVGVVPCLPPGSVELAKKTSEAMASYKSCVLAHHGFIAAGRDYGQAFGITQTVEKAAKVYMVARMANKGNDSFNQDITGMELEEMAEHLGLQLNPKFL